MPQAIINSYRYAVSSDIIAWWKADSFSLADGTAIGGAGNEWQDQSSNNRDATQGTGANQPLFKTNIFGAMPSIRFDGSNDVLEFSEINLGANAAFTVLLVGKSLNGVDGEILGHSVQNRQVRVNRSGDDVSFFGGTLEGISTTFGSALTNVKLISWIVAGTDISFRENKTARGTMIGIGGNTIELNRIGRTSFGGFPNWDIGEIILYSTILSAATIDGLYDTYFQPKWGLP